MYRQPYYSVGSRNSRSTTIYAVSSRSTTQVVPIVLPPCLSAAGHCNLVNFAGHLSDRMKIYVGHDFHVKILFNFS